MPGFRSASCGVECVTGDVSDSPYPCFSGRPVRCSNSCDHLDGTGRAAAVEHRHPVQAALLHARMREQRDEDGGTAGKYVGR